MSSLGFNVDDAPTTAERAVVSLVFESIAGRTWAVDWGLLHDQLSCVMRYYHRFVNQRQLKGLDDYYRRIGSFSPGISTKEIMITATIILPKYSVP